MRLLLWVGILAGVVVISAVIACIQDDIEKD